METKHLVGEIKSVKDSGSFDAILSMPTVDRDGEIIDAGAFNPLPKRITIDVEHGLSVEKTIGSGEPYYDGDVLKVRGTFASTPLAQDVRTLVKEGHVGFMSVAYRAAQYEVDDKDGIPHLRKGELLNAGIVAIPSNREAEILAVKEAKVGARNSAKDLERIQGTHDHMVELGAKCSEKCAHGVEYQTGGVVAAGNTFLVGERGPEIIMPKMTGKIIPNPPPSDSKPIVLNIDGRKFMSWFVDYSKSLLDDVEPTVVEIESADTEPPTAAADEAAPAGAEVEVARASAALEAALAELALG